jgi:hypothetical protein
MSGGCVHGDRMVKSFVLLVAGLVQEPARTRCRLVAAIVSALLKMPRTYRSAFDLAPLEVYRCSRCVDGSGQFFLALTPLPVNVVRPACWQHVLLIKSSRALLAARLLAQPCRFRRLDMETVPLRDLHWCRQHTGSSCRMAAVTIGTRLRRAKQDGKSGGVQMRLRSSTRLPFAPPLIFRRCGMMGPGPAVSARFGRRVVA